MRCTLAIAAALSVVALLAIAAPAAAQVQPDRAAKIRKAAPEKPRVAPKKPRTVLIWNTPPAFMDKDPHKGYCIPFGECAMKNLGEKTGAFTPVISGDLAMYLPEKIRQFDAIVMNNSSGVLSLDTKKTNMNVKWINRKDGDFAQVLGQALRQGPGLLHGLRPPHRAVLEPRPAAVLSRRGLRVAVRTGNMPTASPVMSWRRRRS